MLGDFETGFTKPLTNMHDHKMSYYVFAISEHAARLSQDSPDGGADGVRRGQEQSLQIRVPGSQVEV